MSISKTRQNLVDVARQLFAKNGIANTTMNDIAKASGKGRRTLIPILKARKMFIMPLLKQNLNVCQTSWTKWLQKR